MFRGHALIIYSGFSTLVILVGFTRAHPSKRKMDSLETSTHRLQPLQETEHWGVLPAQGIATGEFFGSSSIIPLGQTSTHFPHPLHAAVTTAVLLTSVMAFWGQTETQSPKPIQAILHTDLLP